MAKCAVGSWTASFVKWFDFWVHFPSPWLHNMRNSNVNLFMLMFHLLLELQLDL